MLQCCSVREAGRNARKRLNNINNDYDDGDNNLNEHNSHANENVIDHNNDSNHNDNNHVNNNKINIINMPSSSSLRVREPIPTVWQYNIVAMRHFGKGECKAARCN